MSNSLNIVRTAFQDLDPTGKVLSTSYGIRVYDDNMLTYNNGIETEEELLSMTPDEILKLADETSDEVADAIRFHQDPHGSIFIDDERYEAPIEPSI